MIATTKRTKNSDGEYRVRLFIDGEYQPGADYYTDDLDDAKSTAKHMEENAVESERDNDVARDELAEYNEETNREETTMKRKTQAERMEYTIGSKMSSGRRRVELKIRDTGRMKGDEVVHFGSDEEIREYVDDLRDVARSILEVAQFMEDGLQDVDEMNGHIDGYIEDLSVEAISSKMRRTLSDLNEIDDEIGTLMNHAFA